MKLHIELNSPKTVNGGKEQDIEARVQYSRIKSWLLDWNLINLGGPTRITETTNTCIDHVLVTSDFCYLDACIDKCDITDHLGILLTTKDTDNVEVEYHKNRNLDGLKNSNLCCKALFYAKHKLDKIDFDNNDINDGFEILTSNLLETMD